MSDSGTPKYLDSDTPKHRQRKLQELKKQRRFGHQKCRWALWLPLSVLAIVAVSIYLKGRPSDVSRWAHIITADKNVTYWYKDANGRTLITPWTKDVDPEAPHPEYPRPQMQRQAWQNLNGQWEFDCTSLTGTAPNLNETLKRKITVPFPVESYLSGIFQASDSNAHMWYRRAFTLPAEWTGSRVLLHFGAVDWQTTVTVNGQELPVHKGGYDKFSFDITDAVDGHSDHHQHELLVQVFDPTEFSHHPVGKQRMHPPRRPSGIFYTANSGIWQTVWLEPVPDAYVERLDLVPDVDKGHLNILVHGSLAARGLKVVVNASSAGHPVGSSTGFVGEGFSLPVPQAHLWSFDDPFLYDLDVILLGSGSPSTGGVQISAGQSDSSPTSSSDESTAAQIVESDLSGLESGTSATGRRLLKEDFRTEKQKSAIHKAEPDPARVADSVFSTVIEDQVDHVRAYFGMRKIKLGRVGGEKNLRPLLNDKFVFHVGMLDQGYWPDGIYTAPTDAALKYDIEASKQMGFNMLRKHIKVEPDRWYYWADHLGILVWQDMPSMYWEDHVIPKPSPQEKAQFELEFEQMINHHKSFPSIVMYVVFNEGWGQYETERVTKHMQALDPTRLYNAASGWVDTSVGHFIDMHKYVGPGAFNPTSNRASVLGEFGGLGLKVDNHQWIPDDSFSYEMQATSSQLEGRYSGLIAQISALMTSPEFSLCAAVYTELTDVEAEVNGMLTYDRQVMKMDVSVTSKVHGDLLALSRQINDGPVAVDQKQLRKAVAALTAPNKGDKGYSAPPSEVAEQARRAQIPLNRVAVSLLQQTGTEVDATSPINPPPYQQSDTFDAATKAAGHRVAGGIHAVWKLLGRSD